jgi:hypothetical protein
MAPELKDECPLGSIQNTPLSFTELEKSDILAVCDLENSWASIIGVCVICVS